MVIEPVLYGVIGSIITWIILVWTLITFRQRIGLYIWKNGFENLMWLSFAHAAQEQEKGLLDDGEEMGLAGNLAPMVGALPEDSPLAKYAPLLQLATQLDGVDLSQLEGDDVAEGLSKIEGWN